MVKVAKDWFVKYYDPYLTRSTIGSKRYDKIAVKEVRFIKQLFQFEKGETLLDVPCGAARHSIKLAKAGLNVTGLDISPACLKESRRKVTKAIAPRISFKQADIRDLRQYHNRFDYVINMCTSLGYFSTEWEHRQAAGELVRSLRPGGQLLIQIVNGEGLESHFKPIDWLEFDDHFLLSKREINPKSNYLLNDWVIVDKKSGRVRRYPHRLRLFSAKELTDMLRAAGLHKIHRYGSLDFEPLKRRDSFWMYLTGTRKS